MINHPMLTKLKIKDKVVVKLSMYKLYNKLVGETERIITHSLQISLTCQQLISMQEMLKVHLTRLQI